MSSVPASETGVSHMGIVCGVDTYKLVYFCVCQLRNEIHLWVLRELADVVAKTLSIVRIKVVFLQRKIPLTLHIQK